MKYQAKIKKRTAALLLAICCTAFTSGCTNKNDPNTVTVLNYGKYLDPVLIDQFEAETGITVKYEEYESPEEMYAKYKAGSIRYDVACTSDYIIQKLIDEGETLDIDFDSIPEFANIDETYLDYCKTFDPDGRYTLPYFFGTVGILYNTKMVDPAETDTWNVLWDEKYSGQIIMENSVRDTYMVAQKLLNVSCNTTDRDILDQSLELLLKQKPLVYSYLSDESADWMAAGNAALAEVYSGEAAYAQTLNEDLAFSVPKEGSNMWVDAWFIPKTCRNKKNAELFLNYLCRADVAMTNFEYVYYATPNKAVYEQLDKDTQQDQTIFPSKETLDNCEFFKPLDEITTNYYTELWEALKAY
ncbi:MAG: ABC transporter substrate-binding protein [Eubacterium sp.]|nr:ABC transporter substrate-binding protein [Eubacterium sp.]